MPQSVEAPTPAALADLVARCDQINRFELRLSAAEELRIAALASGLVVMRQVLGLLPIDPAKLPMRQRRIQHWSLSGSHVREAETPAIHAVHATFALDEHEQIKVLSRRTWRGHWKSVTLWRSGAHGVIAATMMEFLSRLTVLAQGRAPDVARGLLARSEAVEVAGRLLAGANANHGHG